MLSNNKLRGTETPLLRCLCRWTTAATACLRAALTEFGVDCFEPMVDSELQEYINIVLEKDQLKNLKPITITNKKETGIVAASGSFLILLWYAKTN